MSTYPEDLPPEAWDILRGNKEKRILEMCFAIDVVVCCGPDGRSPHYVRLGDGGERTFMSMRDATDLPPLDNPLHQGPPPLWIVVTIPYPNVCEFCTPPDPRI